VQKPLVFISHISEEKQIAYALKEIVETTFLNMIDVFVSSDPTSVRMGRKWLEEITQGLKACAVEIILASPESVKRPWINFEAGCGWIRDIPVIPLCHSGMVPSKLPSPLSALQAATASVEDELKLVFPVLADAIGCRLPVVDFSAFIATVKEFEQDSREIMEQERRSPLASTAGLSSQEIATLAEIGSNTFSPSESIAIHMVQAVGEKVGYTALAVNLALKSLSRKDLIESTTEPDGYYEYTVVKLTDRGWAWLEANKDRLVLTNASPQDVVAINASATSDPNPEADIPF
jgi:DNA-binding MarR family transcriptional regulator